MHWDKKVASVLRQLGFTQEQIGVVIGILAEHRQQADMDGYRRGFESGHIDGIAYAKRHFPKMNPKESDE